MDPVLAKIILGEEIKKQDIYDALYEICDDTHSSCDFECPVYNINDGPLDPSEENSGCACFKNGKAIYDYIMKNLLYFRDHY